MNDIATEVAPTGGADAADRRRPIPGMWVRRGFQDGAGIVAAGFQDLPTTGSGSRW